MIIGKNERDKKLFSEKCRAHKLKMTPQRSVIFEELTASKDHPSAEVLFKRVRKTLPNISFDTVYRTLLKFSELGVVNIVEGYGENKRFEPNLKNHHHFRCMKCHSIIDFSKDSYDKIEIPYEFKNKYHVMNKKVVLEGYCDKCLKK